MSFNKTEQLEFGGHGMGCIALEETWVETFNWDLGLNLLDFWHTCYRR